MVNVILGLDRNGGVTITTNKGLGDSLMMKVEQEMDERDFTKLIEGSIVEVQDRCMDIISGKIVYTRKGQQDGDLKGNS